MAEETRADQINKHLASDGVVMVCNYAHATQYDKRNAGMFFMSGHSLYVKRGKGHVCIDYCYIKFYSYSKTEVTQ